MFRSTTTIQWQATRSERPETKALCLVRSPWLNQFNISDTSQMSDFWLVDFECRKSVAEFNRATAPINFIKEKIMLRALKYYYTKPHQNLSPSERWPPPNEVSSGAVRRNYPHLPNHDSFASFITRPKEVFLSNRVDWTNLKSTCLRKFSTLCSSIGLFYCFCLEELTMGEQHKVNQDTWPITLCPPQYPLISLSNNRVVIDPLTTQNS